MIECHFFFAELGKYWFMQASTYLDLGRNEDLRKRTNLRVPPPRIASIAVNQPGLGIYLLE